MFKSWPESVQYFRTCSFHQLLKEGLGTDIMNISTWSKFNILLNLVFPQFLQDVNILSTCSLFLSRLMYWESTMITISWCSMEENWTLRKGKDSLCPHLPHLALERWLWRRSQEHWWRISSKSHLKVKHLCSYTFLDNSGNFQELFLQ